MRVGARAWRAAGRAAAALLPAAAVAVGHPAPALAATCAQAAATSGGSLATTGLPVVWLLVAGIGCLVVGIAVVLAARGRPTALAVAVGAVLVSAAVIGVPRLAGASPAASPCTSAAAQSPDPVADPSTAAAAVPEAPWTLLLPVSGAGAAVLVVALRRHRARRAGPR